MLATGSNDKSIILWDTDKKRQIRTIPSFQAVHTLAWTTAGRTSALACGTTDDTVRIYNAANGQPLGSLANAASPPNVSSLVWFPNAAMLLAGRSCHSVQLWDVREGKIVRSLPAMAPVQYVTLGGATASMVAAGNSERTVRFWDAETGMPRGVLLEEKDSVAMIGADGNWRWDREKQPDLAFVVQTGDTQVTMTADEFTAQYGRKGKSMRSKSGGRK